MSKTQWGEVNRRLREFIQNDINRFKKTATLPFVCPICRNYITDFKNIHVDHYDKDFRGCVNDFMKSKRIVTSEDFQKYILEDMAKAKSEFIDFHKKNTHLRLICNRCNIKTIRRGRNEIENPQEQNEFSQSQFGNIPFHAKRKIFTPFLSNISRKCKKITINGDEYFTDEKYLYKWNDLFEVYYVHKIENGCVVPSKVEITLPKSS